MTDIQWPTPASLEDDFTLTPRNEPRVMVYIECDTQNGQSASGVNVKHGAGFYLMYARDAEKARKRLVRDGSDAAAEEAARIVFDRALAAHVKSAVGSAVGAERDRLTEAAKASIATSVEAERHKILADKGRKPFGKFVVYHEPVAAPKTPESAAAQSTEALIAALTKALTLATSNGQKQGGR